VTSTYIKTVTEKAWAAERQQRARADRLAAMVKARDAEIALLRDVTIVKRDDEISYLKERRRVIFEELFAAQDTIAKRDATIEQLKAEAAKRAGA
jgi:ABC-type siderophore export system fused ATPase/permease subunit